VLLVVVVVGTVTGGPVLVVTGTGVVVVLCGAG
jgi:hypothetical protein